MVAKRKRYGAEHSIGKLREAEVGLGQGHSVGQVARKLRVSKSRPTTAGGANTAACGLTRRSG